MDGGVVIDGVGAVAVDGAAGVGRVGRGWWGGGHCWDGLGRVREIEI